MQDTDLAFVSKGTPVSFATSATPGRRYSGRVASIDATPIAGTLLYRARIVEANPDFSLRGGLQVSVRVAKTTHPSALTVPRAAVIQDGANGLLYTIDTSSGQAIAKQTTAKLGLQTSEYVEISGPGLRPGMSIVLNQTDNLHDGTVLALPSAAPGGH